jgi:flagellar basal-body rod protein FlgB
MFIDRLLNQGNGPLLEQLVQFTAQRHRLLADNVANVDTPGYRQKDLSVAEFQKRLQERVALRRQAPPGAIGFSDIQQEIENPTRSILAHDGNNRSMEQLMSDEAKNAMMHNFAIELLRKQYQGMEMALRERI